MTLFKAYRKKPVVVHAVKLTEENGPALAEQLPGAYLFIETKDLNIKTLEGVMTANVGDWIIRGVKGEYYPCKPDIFEATYETAGE